MRLMDTTTLGQRLKARRQRAGLSQRELGRRVGLTVSQISRLEGGHREPPISTLLRIASACEADPGAIIRGLAA